MDEALENSPRSLLVVDDQPLNIQAIYEIFSDTHQVRMATTGMQALAACEEQLPDMILLDVMMPELDGYEVCRRLKLNERTRDVPVIFVTAQSDPQDEAYGLELGAVDFITKPINAAVVRARVNTHLQLRAALRLVQQLAYHDALTRLPNRRLLTDRLTQAMAAGRRSNCHGALMFLDLDNFKSLNDVHGHAMGDRLLVEVAERLKHSVRETDTVARLGGDEFVVLLSSLSTQATESTKSASAVAEKIRGGLAAPYFLKRNGSDASTAVVEHRCTGSIGVVLFLGQQDTLDDLFKWADAAMYQAKKAGRNQIKFYA